MLKRWQLMNAVFFLVCLTIFSHRDWERNDNYSSRFETFHIFYWISVFSLWSHWALTDLYNWPISTKSNIVLLRGDDTLFLLTLSGLSEQTLTLCLRLPCCDTRGTNTTMSFISTTLSDLVWLGTDTNITVLIIANYRRLLSALLEKHCQCRILLLRSNSLLTGFNGRAGSGIHYSFHTVKSLEDWSVDSKVTNNNLIIAIEVK